MSDAKELAVIEPESPAAQQQLITIEPKKYVALVFENHRTRADAYKAEAPTVTYDITTTAGMKTAVEWRAKGRDIRVEVTDIHRDRKAPILEIGRLMDARKKEIIADVEPDEDRFDRDIKAETARKEVEKAAKLAAEHSRIAAIRSKIDAMRNRPASMVGKPSDEIGAVADVLSETVIAFEDWQEFSGEAQVERDHAVKKLREMQEAQAAHEAEAARIASEREALVREREAAAERERVAALARAEEERKAREQREAEEARLRTEREAHEARMASERAELARQQAEIAAAKAEQDRIDGERQAAIEAEVRAKREAAEAAAKLDADHAEALVCNELHDAAVAKIAADARAEAERRAAEAEQARRIQIQFEAVGPEADEILSVLADHYDVTKQVACNWLYRHAWAQLEIAA